MFMIFEKFSANNFALSDEEGSTSGPLNWWILLFYKHMQVPQLQETFSNDYCLSEL